MISYCESRIQIGEGDASRQNKDTNFILEMAFESDVFAAHPLCMCVCMYVCMYV